MPLGSDAVPDNVIQASDVDAAPLDDGCRICIAGGVVLEAVRWIRTLWATCV